MKIKFKTLCLIMSLLIFMSGCAPKQMKPHLEEKTSSEVEDKSPTYNSHINLPLTNVESLNPLLVKNSDYYQFSQLMYDSLFTVDEDGRMVPNIVEYYELTNDGKTLSITLKDNVYFHDGEKLTSRDVVETFNALKKLPPDNMYYNLMRHSVSSVNQFQVDSFARAVIFDDRNLDFEFDKPYGSMLSMMVFPILPSHLLNSDEMIQGEDFQPVGSGPFYMEAYHPNQSIELVKNQQYPDALPNVESITGKIFKDKKDQKQAFDAGQVNLIALGDYDWDRYRNQESITIYPYETLNLELISLNLKSPTFQGESGKYLRKALARSIHREKIIGSIYLGQATSTSFFINPENNTGISIKSMLYYNVDSVKKMLDRGQFKYDSEDSWRLDAEGNKLSLRLLVNGRNPLRLTEAQFISDDLNKVGINCEIIQTKTDEEFHEALNSGGYDLLLYGMKFSPVMDIASLLYSGAGASNASHYANPQMDKYLKELSLTADLDQRQILFNQINELCQEDVPYIPLFFENNILMSGPNVKGKLYPNFSNIYHGIENISSVD